MKFGIPVSTKIDDWQLVKYAEDCGFDMAWIPDSQMIWSDCYATMALAAQNTSRIQLGTGVAIPGTRIAPVTAHSIASINPKSEDTHWNCSGSDLLAVPIHSGVAEKS